MENAQLIWTSLFVYLIFTVLFSLFLIFGERYTKKNPKCRFGMFWRRHVVRNESNRSGK